MRYFNDYIINEEIISLNEGLLDKLKAWFSKLFKSQSKLANTTLKVDVKQIKSPEKSSSLKDIEANKEEMNLINDRKVGFPVTSKLIGNKKKYLSKESPDGKTTMEYNTLVDRFFYVDGNTKYDIAMILFDESIKNDNGYVNMLNLEVIPKVDNISQVEKYINDVWETNMKNKKHTGAQYIVTHPKTKAILAKQGYENESKDQNILFKKFK